MGIDIPSEQLFEVFLIGTGNYGESIIVHAGANNWIIIDSCIDPKTKDCLPLSYLKKKRVNLAEDVKLIVCTHWHDDHIKGMANLLRECKSASFSMAIASDRTKFLQLVQLDYTKLKSESSAVSTLEINECLQIINDDRRKCLLATQDKLLLSETDHSSNYEYSVYSLSPSDKVLEDYANEISTLIKDYGSSNKKIIINDPNDKSVVLLIKVNQHSILLGADLEVKNNDKERGWLCILDNSQIVKTLYNKPALFKLPHHGSITGYHQRIWQELTATNAIAELTSCNHGNLPRENMICTIFEHTNDIYITSLPKEMRIKKRNFSVTKAISQFNSTVKELAFTYGVVASYIDFTDENSHWHVEVEGNAQKLDKKQFNS